MPAQLPDYLQAELYRIAFHGACDINQIVGRDLDGEKLGEIQVVLAKAIRDALFALKDAKQHA